MRKRRQFSSYDKILAFSGTDITMFCLPTFHTSLPFSSNYLLIYVAKNTKKSAGILKIPTKLMFEQLPSEFVLTCGLNVCLETINISGDLRATNQFSSHDQQLIFQVT